VAGIASTTLQSIGSIFVSRLIDQNTKESRTIDGDNDNQGKLHLWRIKFEIDKVVALTRCHCSVCRKESGASFATLAHVRRERFRLISDEGLINPGYEWTPGHSRSFCKRCGSPAPKYIEATRMVSVPAGLLDDDPGVRPSMHVFTSSKVAWVDLNDDLQKYEKWVPGFVPEDLASG